MPKAKPAIHRTQSSTPVPNTAQVEGMKRALKRSLIALSIYPVNQGLCDDIRALLTLTEEQPKRTLPVDEEEDDEQVVH